MIIENGPQVSSVIERVKGCKEVLAKHPGHQDPVRRPGRQGLARRRHERHAGLPDPLPDDRRACSRSTIRRPSARDLAAKQLNRSGIVITSVDGAPDIEPALKGNTPVQASASQNPTDDRRTKAVQIGYDIMNGKKPENPMVLMPSTLVNRDNVGSYKGW